uniref:Uncharacterized protein n=1 Tax=Rhabditophanes sp. KR3021 TaxID=114890 RepID=A0AC35UHH0_9BILA
MPSMKYKTLPNNSTIIDETTLSKHRCKGRCHKIYSKSLLDEEIFCPLRCDTDFYNFDNISMDKMEEIEQVIFEELKRCAGSEVNALENTKCNKVSENEAKKSNNFI